MKKKKCIRCLKRKGEEFFYKHAGMADGRLGKCKDCCIADAKLNRLKNIDHYKEFDRRRANDPDRVAARRLYATTDACAKSMKKGREKYLAEKPERRKETLRKHYQKHKDRYVEAAQKRARSQSSRTPGWLSVEHREEMRCVYLAARAATRDTGIVHHVDHIVPLRGKTVSGLHVPWNLRVITATENFKKNNKVIEELVLQKVSQ